MGARPPLLRRTCPPDNSDTLSGFFWERDLQSLPVTRTDSSSLSRYPLSGLVAAVNVVPATLGTILPATTTFIDAALVAGASSTNDGTPEDGV